MSRKYVTLPPLPGGNDQYFKTLIDVLTHIDQHGGKLHRRNVIAYFIVEYEAAKSSANQYIQVLQRFDLVNVNRIKHVHLSESGKHLLTLPEREQTTMVARILFEKFMSMGETLNAFVDAEEFLHIHELIPLMERDDVTLASRRTHWLLSLGLIEQVEGQNYRVTPYGQEISQTFREIHKEISLPNQLNEPNIDNLCEELIAASRDSFNPSRLEIALMRAFRYLGTEAYHLGGPGKTDVIVRAGLGSSSFTAIVDAKSRETGKLTDIDVDSLHRHRIQHEADFVVVVAMAFASGRILDDAYENDITLLSVEVLCNYLELHDKTPMPLSLLRRLFVPGLVSKIPSDVTAEVDDIVATVDAVEKAVNILLDQGAGIHTTQDLYAAIAASDPKTAHKYEHVQAVVELLKNPIVGFLNPSEDELIPVMGRQIVKKRIHSLNVAIRR